MAGRNYTGNRVFNFHVFPVCLDAVYDIGSSGAPTIRSGTGKGITGLTRLAAGQYRLQLDDNYNQLFSFQASLKSPVTGSGIAATALTPGLVYQIVTLGTTTQANWVTAGLPVGITAAVGVTFKCAATSSGNGTAKLLGTSGVSCVELLGDNTGMLSNQPFIQGGGGGFIDFQCMGPASHTHDLKIIGGQAAASTAATAWYATDIFGKEAATDKTIAGADSATKGGVIATTAALAAVDPTSGSALRIAIMLSNSSQG